MIDISNAVDAASGRFGPSVRWPIYPTSGVLCVNVAARAFGVIWRAFFYTELLGCTCSEYGEQRRCRQPNAEYISRSANCTDARIRTQGNCSAMLSFSKKFTNFINHSVAW